MATVSLSICAQEYNTPVAYMNYINNANKALSVKFLGYISASSHGKNMKKVEKRRADLLDFIYETRIKIYEMPSYNGDKALRDSAVSYLKIMYSVFNEDYSKLVNMEEIAEQSYDAMEAYLLAQEKAGERLNQAYDAYGVAYNEFAKNNNVTLIDTESELEQKLSTANKVSEYYHQVYLIFFKCYKQEMYLMDALTTNNMNALEQNRSALISVCEEGLGKLKELKGYSGDRSLEATCRSVLLFLKDEAEKKIPVLYEYAINKENVEKLGKSLESKSASERTKNEVDSYNNAVAVLNKSVTAYNNTNQELNARRKDILNNYNSSVQSFMSTHMPYSR
ncbi:MAG: hypothetical protein J7497_05495 [Chitinophagaceae bacterium]|nr:hypothetical protein [Chitinophagaceae bacterium]